MKFHKIICFDFKGNEFTNSTWKKIDQLCEQIIQIDHMASQLTRELQDADCLLVKLGAKVDQDFLKKTPKLHYIGMLGTGYGGIDTGAAAAKGITVTNIADYATEGVAEFTFGILLEHLRDVIRAKAQAASGDYTDNFVGREISGKKFGVIGLGVIGQRTAEIAHVFGAEVHYWSRTRKKAAEAKGIIYCELDELLAQSDILTLNLALNQETEGIINAERITQIKKGVIFINPSPMELIDFEALAKRLKKQDMTFILDHSDEMTKQQLEALQTLPNAIPYPPIAYLTEEAGELKQQVYFKNLKNYLAGRPTNQVN